MALKVLKLVIIGCKVIKTVGSVELDVGSGSGSDNISAVSHERFVMSDELHGVLQLPTVTTEILET